MIIKISYPSKITPRVLKKRTLEFQRSMKHCPQASTQTNSVISKAQILLSKNNMLLHYDVTDSTATAALQEYLSFVFRDTLIGVDQQNPLTMNLKNVNVFLFAEGRTV